MGNKMPYSATPDTTVSSVNGKHADFIWAAAIVKGWRRNQEDRYQTVMDLNEDYSYFAVFDGHGGFEIAEYLKRNFHFFMRNYLSIHPNDVEIAMHMAFLDFDFSLRHPGTIRMLNKLVEEYGTQSVAAQLLRRQGAPTLREIASVAFMCSDYGAPSTSNVDNVSKGLTDSKIPVISDSSSGSSRSTIRQDAIEAASTSKDEGISKAEADSKTSVPSDIPANQPSSSSSGPVDAIPSDTPGPSNAPELQYMSGPLQYLLNDELDSTDTDDSDFNIDEEESLSEDSDIDMDSDAFMRQEPGDFSGSTATVVLIGKKRLHVANIGDSRCVLSRNGQAIDLSVDHNLDNPEERQRVISAGASVSSDGRVNDSVNISRAFGDFHLKGCTDIPVEQPVIAEPSVKTIAIQDEDEFVIIASDGIWNSFPSQVLVDFVGQRIKAKDGCLIDICEEVFHFVMPDQMTLDGTGLDNMTMIIIKLNATSDHDYLFAESSEMEGQDYSDDAFEMDSYELDSS